MTAAGSEEVRQKGNDLYRAGRLTEAIVFYERAAELSPQDAAPYSNLSAAFFELGEYGKAIEHCDSGLALATDQAAKQKLRIRKARCSLFMKDSRGVLDALGEAPQSGEAAGLAIYARNLKPSGRAQSTPAEIRKRIVLTLPRYKPAIRNIPEYYTVGHDAPESLYDRELLGCDRDKISLLFAGVGDGRNLFQTLMEIGMDAKNGKLPSKKSFHLTAVDIKPAVIARDLLFFLMLDHLSAREGIDAMIATGELHLFYYTFISPIMPAVMYGLLQQHIRRVLDGLANREQLPCFVDVPDLNRRQIIRVLRQWQEEVPKEFPTARMRERGIRGRQQYLAQRSVPHGLANKMNRGYERQDAFFLQTGVLMMGPSDDYLVGRELPALLRAYEKFDRANPKPVNQAILGRPD